LPLSEDQIRALARSTSVGAVAYQAAALKRELERINEQDYPQEACQIRDVFLCWPEFILSQLVDIHASNPDGASGPTAVRVRTLGLTLQTIYSFVRYLTASSARQAPPPIQSALNQLLRAHFPAAYGRPLCIVRPQWSYNLSYVPLSRMLETLASPAALDPNSILPATESEEIPGALWTWRRNLLKPEEQALIEADPPKHIAVLSFAGLDTHDAFLYPILAHELGHFIDFSSEPLLNLSPAIVARTQIAFKDVTDILASKWPSSLVAANIHWKSVVARVNTCVRELLADLLGLRMMGFGFFAAQTELLKTTTSWPDAEPLVSRSGYPGTKFRFWSLLRALLANYFRGNLRRFFAEVTPPNSLALANLEHYLSEWESLVQYSANLQDLPPIVDPGAEPDLPRALDALAANAVLRGYDAILDVARATIPDASTASLSPAFYDRIERLRADLPPSLGAERKDSFSEVMAAAWAYQLTYGEERERGQPDHADQLREYEKTCRLVLKAVELIPDVDAEPVHLDATEAPETGTVLSKRHISRRLELPPMHKEHLAVVPLNSRSVEAASMDVRLGSWFVALRRTRLPGVRLGHETSDKMLGRIGREETFVSPGNRYLIHPGDLILGATLEFVALPADLMAFVEGKSKWGRLGLIVATASQVAPGFHGVIVLELANAGTVPIELEPSTPIAQIVFQRMSAPLPPDDLYRGKFYCQVKQALKPQAKLLVPSIRSPIRSTFLIVLDFDQRRLIRPR
jgi:dCTP deaminase